MNDVPDLFVLESSPWTPQRTELARWLRERAPSFEDGYVGAVRLLHMPSFPGRVHFICHVVRDIYRQLPAALGASTLPKPSEIFPSMVKQLSEIWPRSDQLEEPNNTNAMEKNSLDSRTYRLVDKIVAKHRSVAVQPSVGKCLAVALFRAAQQPSEAFIPPWLIKSFDSEYDFFVKRAHLVRSMDKVPTNEGLIEHFEAFERALHSLVGLYFTGKSELDAILQDTNAAGD
jgi:hypothetical protein